LADFEKNFFNLDLTPFEGGFVNGDWAPPARFESPFELVAKLLLDIGSLA
jgi:hypothetical protein